MVALEVLHTSAELSSQKAVYASVPNEAWTGGTFRISSGVDSGPEFHARIYRFYFW